MHIRDPAILTSELNGKNEPWLDTRTTVNVCFALRGIRIYDIPFDCTSGTLLMAEGPLRGSCHHV